MQAVMRAVAGLRFSCKPDMHPGGLHIELCAGLVCQKGCHPSPAMSLLDNLSDYLLAKILAMASSVPEPDHEAPSGIHPHILPQAVGQLMLPCKRFAAAVRSAAFWQESWVLSETTSFFDPSLAHLITRLAMDLSSLQPIIVFEDPPIPGRHFCFQPHLDRLKELRVCLEGWALCLRPGSECNPVLAPLARSLGVQVNDQMWHHAPGPASTSATSLA